MHDAPRSRRIDRVAELEARVIELDAKAARVLMRLVAARNALARARQRLHITEREHSPALPRGSRGSLRQ